MALPTMLLKAKNAISKGRKALKGVKNISEGEQFTNSLLNVIKTSVITVLSTLAFPIIAIGGIVLFVVAAYMMITSVPLIVFGVDLGSSGSESSNKYCNEDPSKAEYAYEPLKGGLAIPHYRQGDPRWGSKKMWDYDFKEWMTFEEVGCAYSAFAMVASYLLDQKIYPDDVAAKLNASEYNDTESWVDYFGPISDLYNIKRPVGVSDWESMKKAIKNGQPVIAWYRGGGVSVFTNTGHFIVVRGMTSDGKYLVNDPSDNTPGYKDKFINRHFTESEMTSGFGWGVIFDAKVCTNGSGIDYLQWAIDIANDDSHGYSQQDRYGPDYDCSSLVWYSLLNSGYSEEQLGGGPFATGGMDAILTKIGFTRYNYSEDELQPGDILWRSEHTAIYVGNGQVVHASKPDKDGLTGDQNGDEILIGTNYGNWTAFYRKDT